MTFGMRGAHDRYARRQRRAGAVPRRPARSQRAGVPVPAGPRPARASGGGATSKPFGAPARAGQERAFRPADCRARPQRDATCKMTGRAQGRRRPALPARGRASCPRQRRHGRTYDYGDHAPRGPVRLVARFHSGLGRRRHRLRVPMAAVARPQGASGGVRHALHVRATRGGAGVGGGR